MLSEHVTELSNDVIRNDTYEKESRKYHVERIMEKLEERLLDLDSILWIIDDVSCNNLLPIYSSSLMNKLLCFCVPSIASIAPFQQC